MGAPFRVHLDQSHIRYFPCLHRHIGLSSSYLKIYMGKYFRMAAIFFNPRSRMGGGGVSGGPGSQNFDF